MVSAVKYLHTQRITHRDLKPENVLLNKPSKDKLPLVKITDFGLSKIMEGSLMNTVCGTLTHIAPEVLDNSGSYTEKVDIWSLGVILFTSLAGSLPFPASCRDDLKQQILQAGYKFPESFSENVSEDAKDLIRKMLVLDPDQRISIDGILNHPWLQDEEMKREAHGVMCVDNDVSMASITESYEPPEKKPKLERNC